MRLRNGYGKNIVELVTAVFLLSVLALLAANIFVIYTGITHNDEACRLISIAAAQAAEEGQDHTAITFAAQNELSRFGSGGFFIRGPKLIYFTHNQVGNNHKIKVSTQTEVLLPAPLLAIGSKPIIVLERTYLMNFNEPSASNKRSSTDDAQDSQ
jgi:hypothetical protein